MDLPHNSDSTKGVELDWTWESPKFSNFDRDSIVRGTVQAIQFTWPEDDDDATEYSCAQVAQLSDEAEKVLRGYVDKFLAMLEGVETPPNQPPICRAGGWDISESLGHDIWFTTQGHGVGFWDKGRWIGAWRECNEFCEQNPLSEAFLGEDGLIHLYE
jgi:hypothetical protein